MINNPVGKICPTDNSIPKPRFERTGWSTDNIVPDKSDIIYVAVKTILNTEMGISDFISVSPATFGHDAATGKLGWTLIDKDVFIETKDIHSIIKSSTLYINDSEPDMYTKMYSFILARNTLPAEFKDGSDFSIVGYNRKHKKFIKISSCGSLETACDIIDRIHDDMRSRNAAEYPFVSPDGFSVDWLEIYRTADVGKLDKRLGYTNNRLELKKAC